MMMGGKKFTLEVLKIWGENRILGDINGRQNIVRERNDVHDCPRVNYTDELYT